MKIVICASIDVTPQIKELRDRLLALGHQVEIPKYSEKIIAGELTLEEFLAVKEKSGDVVFRAQAGEDLIRRYYKLIKEADAVFVLNVDKKGIKNYIGGNTFLEMGFAHALEKKIYLLNPIPDLSYRDELVAMEPLILNNNLSQIN